MEFPHEMNNGITRKRDGSTKFPFNNNVRKYFKTTENIYTQPVEEKESSKSSLTCQVAISYGN